ncbi:shikimate kinase [Helicobacter muridarum]|uniref:Shikimate kinase n=1 Tax=Helicobacter muridarum TaxID=216 RepID=A0A099TZ06_9HELI|nr:shikimate kinase [Helicobacter muridarum]TLE01188.1 shikimate kinase [Helicobacter muridarum]STQ86065.1 shikimate kinase [Helicobacter muridarum]
MQNIVLIGFMGSGKSSIASMLAKNLDKSLIDSDSYIESIQKTSIKDIFASKGEHYFRLLEKNFIDEFENSSNNIIATGGGMPIFNDISKLGIAIYLKIDFDSIVQRIINEVNTRPLFKDIQKAKELYIQREPLYTKASKIIINANTNPTKIMQDIMKAIDDKTK